MTSSSLMDALFWKLIGNLPEKRLIGQLLSSKRVGHSSAWRASFCVSLPSHEVFPKPIAS